ncbi:hypothetical protein Tco_1287906, partial [Tanacetum coccineum]
MKRKKKERKKKGALCRGWANVELRADVELKDTIVVAMLKPVGGGVLYMYCLDVVKNLKKPIQALRGVSVGPKKDVEHTKEVSNSNVLNLVENDVDLGTNDGTLNLASKKANASGSSLWNVESSSTSTTLIVEKIDKIERLIIDGNVTLVHNVGEPLEKGDSLGDNDSEDEVESVDNEMTSILASKKISY